VNRLLRHCLVAVLAATAVAALPVAGADATTSGAKRITYKFGPVNIASGQNTISLEPNHKGWPQVPGYITRFKPDLIRVSDGSIPRVDVLHLHHAVWLVNGYPQFAAGEEKTIADLPPGYGWRSLPSDTWVMNHMIHNLYPKPDKVYITYTIDFIPDTSPMAKKMKAIRTQWMDVEGIKAYPVFDVLKGTGAKGKFTFPKDAPDAYKSDNVIRNQYRFRNDAVLVQTAAHLHPGGLHGDLYLTRAGKKVRLFRSNAKYFEPAGAVSWDVSMEATPKDWRVQVKKGDILSVEGTYDTKRSSWYESMAIMPVAVEDNAENGVDPFGSSYTPPKGVLTHGHLSENRNHGGAPTDSYVNAGDLADGPIEDGGTVHIKGYVYQHGNLTDSGDISLPPVVPQGKSMTFFNDDSDKTIWHTITACKAPCNKKTGIAYPLADANVQFDSGQLGFGPTGLTAAANRQSWSTPSNLAAGTYTYFCRVHPFMRGSFRVK
jgi:plastocyanin